jgi:hypothetical protein
MTTNSRFSPRERVLLTAVFGLFAMFSGFVLALVITDESGDPEPSSAPIQTSVESDPSSDDTQPGDDDVSSTTSVPSSFDPTTPIVVTDPTLPKPPSTTPESTTSTTTPVRSRRVNLSITIHLTGFAPSPGDVQVAPNVDCFRRDHYEVRNNQLTRINWRQYLSKFGETVDGVELLSPSTQTFSFELNTREQATCILAFQIMGSPDWYSTHVRDSITRINGRPGPSGTAMECQIPIVGEEYYFDLGDGPEFLPFASENGCDFSVELVSE